MYRLATKRATKKESKKTLELVFSRPGTYWSIYYWGRRSLWSSRL